MRLARDCRRVVQACLREEEWADADEKFFEIILAGLTSGGERGQHADARADGRRPA